MRKSEKRRLIVVLLLTETIMTAIIIWVAWSLEWSIWIRQFLIAGVFIAGLFVADRHKLW